MRGLDKLLIRIDGIPLLRRTAEVALAAHAPVCVALRPQDHARALALQGLELTTIAVPDADQGLSASLRAGASAINRGRLLILPADMPDVTSADLRLMIAAADESPDAIVRATGADGTPGHPVIFPSDLLPDFATLAGDAGARTILHAHQSRLRLIELPGQNALTDLDTPEAWAAWRQSLANSTRTS